jgi:hypothetical protein
MNDELERILKEVVMAQLRYNPGISLKSLMETMKIIQDGCSQPSIS